MEQSDSVTTNYPAYILMFVFRAVGHTDREPIKKKTACAVSLTTEAVGKARPMYTQECIDRHIKHAVASTSSLCSSSLPRRENRHFVQETTKVICQGKCKLRSFQVFKQMSNAVVCLVRTVYINRGD